MLLAYEMLELSDFHEKALGRRTS